jgi:hypothetical protein
LGAVRLCFLVGVREVEVEKGLVKRKEGWVAGEK